MITVLAGGAGAARFLRGLVRAVPPEEVTVIGNTGDDIEMSGVHVSPDLDIVTYALGGVWDESRGFGITGDTHDAMAGLEAAGEPSWFALGDLDLANCLARTVAMREGASLHECAARLAAGYGVKTTILPMTSDPVHTVVTTKDGRALHFQEYWVRERGVPEVASVHLEGAQAARPAPGVVEAIADADVLVFAPSNPVVSIGTILEVPGIREAVAAGKSPRVAISPIIAGKVVRGMADRLMGAAGEEVSALGVARLYRGLIDRFVIDEADEALAEPIASLGIEPVVAPTLMHTPAHAEALARVALGEP